MKPEKIYLTKDVYGMQRDLPLNYVVRETDKMLVDELSRNKHIIIYGSSKQGKTNLRKKNLPDDSYVVITCLNTWKLEDLFSAILKKIGYEIVQSTTTTQSGGFKIKAGFPSLSSGSIGAEGSAKSVKETKKVALELDPGDVNDFLNALAQIGFQKYLVLEDFHYLPNETQRDFSFALKAIHEASKLTFIVVGVWREKNRLAVFNGDLTGRMVDIDVDTWSSSQLLEVISDGAAMLNIQFHAKFSDALMAGSHRSVFIVQEACYKACIQEGVEQTQGTFRAIAEKVDAMKIIKEVVDQSAARYNAFLDKFAEGKRTTELEMYRWILYPVLVASQAELEKGLSYNRILKTIQAKHPEGAGLKAGNLTLAFDRIAGLQLQKGVRPIVLDYNKTDNILNIVDAGFLIWLAHQDRITLLARLELPTT